MNYGAPLPWGVRIGPKAEFRGGSEVMVLFGSNSIRGAWLGVYNRFLGLKFQISGQTHYGWVNVDIRSRTVLGYAYETNANQPILAGAKSGPEKIGAADPAPVLAPSKQPATLGVLARGADGLSLWRREEE